MNCGSNVGRGCLWKISPQNELCYDIPQDLTIVVADVVRAFNHCALCDAFGLRRVDVDTDRADICGDVLYVQPIMHYAQQSQDEVTVNPRPISINTQVLTPILIIK